MRLLLFSTILGLWLAPVAPAQERWSAPESLARKVEVCTALQPAGDAEPAAMIGLADRNMCKTVGVDLEPGLSADAAAAWAKTKAGKICAKYPDWPREVCGVVAEKSAQLGMTAAQLLASWGKPRQIYRSLYERVEREEWMYGGMITGGMGAYRDTIGRIVYAMFENGLLKSLHENRR
jgi:hypothetical protein